MQGMAPTHGHISFCVLLLPFHVFLPALWHRPSTGRSPSGTIPAPAWPHPCCSPSEGGSCSPTEHLLLLLWPWGSLVTFSSDCAMLLPFLKCIFKGTTSFSGRPVGSTLVPAVQLRASELSSQRPPLQPPGDQKLSVEAHACLLSYVSVASNVLRHFFPQINYMKFFQALPIGFILLSFGSAPVSLHLSYYAVPEIGCGSHLRTHLPSENEIIASLALPQTVIAQWMHIFVLLVFNRILLNLCLSVFFLTHN